MEVLSFNQRTLNWLTEKILKFPDVIDMFQDALILAHRALAAFRALRRRCSGVMLAARALPPILPPSRPSSDSIWDRRERGGCSGSLGRSPNNLCTAIKPAWTSSSGSLPDGFRIHSQRGTFGSAPSSPGFFKVAHYLKAVAARRHIGVVSRPARAGFDPFRVESF